MERQRPATVTKATIPVTFPESYPFSLVASLPDVSRGSGAKSSSRETESLFNPGQGETAIVFLVLILSSPTKHILNFLESSLDIEGRDRFIGLLSQFFNVATSILENDAFPKTWLNVNILAHKILIKMMDPVATILEKEFIPAQESESLFDSNLWREALHMLLKLLSSDQLVIEEFSPQVRVISKDMLRDVFRTVQKRRAVWRLAGDIRGEGASILLTLWQALGWAEHISTIGEVATRYGESLFHNTFINLVNHIHRVIRFIFTP